MENSLLQLAIAPALIFLFYIYIRDKYEKEPIRLLTTGVLYGMIATFPIIILEDYVQDFTSFQLPVLQNLYDSYVIAAFSEESVKLLILYLLTWNNVNLNESFDGIVYAVFISLGFAAVENLFYVFDIQMGGFETAIYRGLLSIPGHGLFAVFMGYEYAQARFQKKNRVWKFCKAFFTPILVHGTFDFLLCYKQAYVVVLFYAYVAWLWVLALDKMKKQLAKSPFKNNKRKGAVS